MAAQHAAAPRASLLGKHERTPSSGLGGFGGNAEFEPNFAPLPASDELTFDDVFGAQYAPLFPLPQAMSGAATVPHQESSAAAAAAAAAASHGLRHASDPYMADLAVLYGDGEGDGGDAGAAAGDSDSMDSPLAFLDQSAFEDSPPQAPPPQPQPVAAAAAAAAGTASAFGADYPAAAATAALPVSAAAPASAAERLVAAATSSAQVPPPAGGNKGLFTSISPLAAAALDRAGVQLHALYDAVADPSQAIFDAGVAYAHRILTTSRGQPTSTAQPATAGQPRYAARNSHHLH